MRHKQKQAQTTTSMHIDAAQALDALATATDDAEQTASYVADAAEHRRAASVANQATVVNNLVKQAQKQDNATKAAGGIGHIAVATEHRVAAAAHDQAMKNELVEHINGPDITIEEVIALYNVLAQNEILEKRALDDMVEEIVEHLSGGDVTKEEVIRMYCTLTE